MRDIKFRAYHIEQKKMINIENLLSFSNDGDIWINENKQMPLNVFSGWASKDFKLMQYTGLKDKNGVEIYEGDILYHHLQGNRFVEYGSPFKNYGGYMLVSKGGMRGTLNDTDSLYEVIGNIYKDSHLLDNN